jgi:succinyl-CoA synthetase beta subunit
VKLLYEFSGKGLLKQSGIPVPAGCVVTAVRDIPEQGYPFMAKAQVLAGGRGKAGLVKRVASREEARTLFNDWLGKSHKGKVVKAVLFETITVPVKELYLAICIDGLARAPVLMASGCGGVDVESVDDSKILREKINPIIGMQDFQARKIISFLNFKDEAAAQLTKILTALYEIFCRYQCELVEINPLGVTTSGDLVALDAKVVTDDKAAASISAAVVVEDGDPQLTLEEKFARVGIAAVETSGDIAVVTTGAGCAMATADTIVAMGGTVKGIVDMGGVLGCSAEEIGGYMGMVGKWKPKTVLVNLFMQATDLEKMAQAIVVAKGIWDPGTRIVIRCKGYNFVKGAAVLDANGLYHSKSFSEACEKAVR